jgi:RNA polymerase sigma factor for flagellar operon FliA
MNDIDMSIQMPSIRMPAIEMHLVPSRGPRPVTVAPAAPSAPVVLRNEDLLPYMPLVHEEVGRMLRRLPPSVQKDDLVAAGACGLMDALRKNAESARGPQFEWYARIRIRGAVLDELRNQDWLSRGQRAEVTVRAEQEQRSVNVLVSFDDLPEHKRLMPASEDDSPLELAERQSQRVALSRAVSALPEREAQIIQMHYFNGVQFKEIAAVLKVSEPRISQLHARAVSKLRDILKDSE